MSFLKKRRKLFIIVFCIYFIVQHIAIQYGRSYRSQTEAIDEVNQLKKVWHKAAVEDLITPEKVSDHTELKLAYARLKEAEREIQESEKRLQERGITGKKGEICQKVHVYYRHSASALIAIVDFLLTKKEEYSVNGNEINFESETDRERFRELINQLSSLHQEKQDLDAFILHYNKKFKKKLSA